MFIEGAATRALKMDNTLSLGEQAFLNDAAMAPIEQEGEFMS